MDLVLVFIITVIVLWKGIYTIKLIFKFLDEKNIMHTCMNIAIFLPYIMYFYFLVKAASGRLQEAVEQHSMLMFIFIVLTFLNILYDFKYNCIHQSED